MKYILSITFKFTNFSVVIVRLTVRGEMEFQVELFDAVSWWVLFRSNHIQARTPDHPHSAITHTDHQPSHHHNEHAIPPSPSAYTTPIPLHNVRPSNRPNHPPSQRPRNPNSPGPSPSPVPSLCVCFLDGG